MQLDEMRYFDVGMDWLSEFSAHVDCAARTVLWSEGNPVTFHGGKRIPPVCLISSRRSSSIVA